MFSKGFILSVGLSLCSTILIYLYVKSRINNLENKVNSLIQIIQTHDQMSHGSQQMQMGAGQCNYEKIVVSDDEDEDDESSDEESSDEEEEEVQGTDNVVVEETVTHDDLIGERKGGEDEGEEEEMMDDKVTSSVMDLTSSHMLHDMEEHVVSPDADGLDDMDDLDDDLDEEEDDEEDDEEKVDYSNMGKVELRLLCEAKGLNVKGKKKHELLEILGQ